MYNKIYVIKASKDYKNIKDLQKTQRFRKNARKRLSYYISLDILNKY